MMKLADIPGDHTSEPANLRSGTLRYTREDGSVAYAEPGSMWYSTLTMVAQHVWDCHTFEDGQGVWESIDID